MVSRIVPLCRQAIAGLNAGVCVIALAIVPSGELEGASLRRELPGWTKPLPSPGVVSKIAGVIDARRVISRPWKTNHMGPVPAELVAFLQAEEARNYERRLQIGLSRPFDVPIIVNGATNPGQWTVVQNDWRALSVEVSSEGALGIRLHFEALSLPAGAQILLFDAGGQLASAISADAVLTGGDLWAPTVFSERVTVECQVPPDADAQQVSFAITGLSHIYKALVSAVTDKEGACEVDASCYPGYSTQASGVALISYVSGGNTYTCSGCALAAAQSGGAEYFLTARHCISSQALASTLEFYWFFQTSRCNGTPPAITSVPATTGGADLLASGTASDFSFLRLRQAAPGGVTFLGWSVNPPNTGERLVCIHHPDGAYKRIAIGTYYGSDADFWASRWSTGVTEGGSSGSPLLNANLKVIGQLNGGFAGPGSSCANPAGPDQFGRFDVTYPYIKQWIDPGTSSAPPTTAGTYYGLFSDQSGGGNPDTCGSFTVTTTAKGRLSGRLRMEVGSWSFTGGLDDSGGANVTVYRAALNPLTLQLQIDQSGDAESLTGSLSDGTWVATLKGDRAVLNGRTLSSDQAGRYTLIVPANGSAPAGNGYGSVVVANNGRLTFVGSLADGARVTQSTYLSTAGAWPLYVPLYGAKGYLYSWVNFASTADSDLSGQLHWYKSSDAGFSVVSSLTGSSYKPPTISTPLLGLSEATLALTGGPLLGQIQGEIWLHPNGHVSNESELRLSLGFSPSSGTFSGSVVDPETRRSIPIRGVALQKQNLASGYFLQSGQSGQVVVEHP